MVNERTVGMENSTLAWNLQIACSLNISMPVCFPFFKKGKEKEIKNEKQTQVSL
jgi:hypothetical protein